jgi:hypothetical protein
MNRTCARIWLCLAFLLFLASGQWLSASCTQDEPTSTVLREAPAGDWCRQTDYANCYYLRANFSSGAKICEAGTTDEWNIPTGCDECPSSVTALKWCEEAGAQGAWTTVTLWRCESAATNCP